MALFAKWLARWGKTSIDTDITLSFKQPQWRAVMFKKQVTIRMDENTYSLLEKEAIKQIQSWAKHHKVRLSLSPSAPKPDECCMSGCKYW